MTENSEHITLIIKSLNPEGLGIAHHKGQTYGVPYSLPGETVIAQVQGKKKGLFLCKLVRIDESSAKRTSANCDLYSICGGCHLQHMDYSEQLHFKVKNLKTILNEKWWSFLKEIEPASSPWNYRNRITLHKRKSDFGFYKAHSHDIVPVQNCPIASIKLNEKLKKLQASDFGQNKTIELREDSGEGFTQVNRQQNQKLIELILQETKAQKSATLLELYCGSGNFTFPLARQCKKIIAIEGHAKAIEWAEKQRIEKSVKNIQFVANSVHNEVFERMQNFEKFSTIICDPPREGLQKTASLITRFKAQKIIYVSCAPKTFAKDAEILLQKGYQLKSIQPIDMFPQTYHIEILATFEKSK